MPIKHVILAVLVKLSGTPFILEELNAQSTHPRLPLYMVWASNAWLSLQQALLMPRFPGPGLGPGFPSRAKPSSTPEVSSSSILSKSKDLYTNNHNDNYCIKKSQIATEMDKMADILGKSHQVKATVG